MTTEAGRPEETGLQEGTDQGLRGEIGGIDNMTTPLVQKSSVRLCSPHSLSNVYEAAFKSLDNGCEVMGSCRELRISQWSEPLYLFYSIFFHWCLPCGSRILNPIIIGSIKFEIQSDSS